jgi:hypothetical protein
MKYCKSSPNTGAKETQPWQEEEKTYARNILL